MKIIQIPMNCGALSKKKGIEKAPEEIVKDFEEMFLNESFEEPKYEIRSININNSNIDEAHEAILSELPKIVENTSDKVCILGGDHSLTYSTVKSQDLKNALLLVFDAHPDLENSRQSHEDYLRNLIEDRIVKEEDVCLVGLRSFSKNEAEFLRKHDLKYFDMKQVFEMGVKTLADKLKGISLKYNEIYLSIDIDVVDPAFAPGTGYIEPGGLTSRELLYILHRIKDKVRRFEIVEVNPEKDVNRMTTKLTAKIIWELY